MSPMGAKIEKQLEEILKVLGHNPGGLDRCAISDKLSFSLNTRTLQRRLAHLLKTGVIGKEGGRRSSTYFIFAAGAKAETPEHSGSQAVFSEDSQGAIKRLQRPVYLRARVTYKRLFLEEYIPNKTFYIPVEKRKALARAGRRADEKLAAGSYVRQICQKLLVDLSYNSSRLEGNNYSKLDTQKLIEQGIGAEGRIYEETVMIINHKKAILFLIENARDVQLAPLTIFNLHNLLSQDLLRNPRSCGSIRKVDVDIGKSAYKPLNNPRQLAKIFELILFKARKIEDPFEQSFFVLIHLSYLQAFEDVNKRTARLSCNIPFIKENLCPLSFTEVSRGDCSAALLTIYEQNDIRPMLDLYCWAYKRSCEQYQVVKDTPGAIDALRVEYRQQRKDVMRQIAKKALRGVDVDRLIAAYCHKNNIEEADRFAAVTLDDLKTLHSGTIAGPGISAEELPRWTKNREPE